MFFPENIKIFILKLLPVDEFVHHVATLMTGTIVASALGLIVMPILTRIYKPEDFGLLAVYSSLLGLLSVIVCCRYELAIVLPEKDEDAANILLLCFILCFLIVGLTFLVVSFFHKPFAHLLNSPSLSNWLFFLPLSLMAFGLFRIFNYWSTRRKHFKRLSTRRIMQSSVTAVAQMSAGFLCKTPNVAGLISGTILGQVASAGTLAWQVERDEGHFIRKSISRARLIHVAKRYKKFPFFDIWSALLNAASGLLPVLLLSYYFNPAVVGFYALGFQILSVPMSFMGDSIAQVFFPHANESKNNGTLNQLTLNIFNRLLTFGFVPFLLIAILAPELFSLIFGEKWYLAGVYVRWMSAWFLLVFISSPLSMVYAIMEKQFQGLIVNIVIFCSRLAALIIGGIIGNAVAAIALFGATGAILWVFNCIYIQYLAGVSITKVFISLIQQILYGLPYAILPIATYMLTNSSVAFITAGLISGLFFLAILVYRMKKESKIS